jgi:hypothetical protein
MAARSESKHKSHFSKKPMHALLAIVYSIRHRLPQNKKIIDFNILCQNFFYQPCDDIDRCQNNGS